MRPRSGAPGHGFDHSGDERVCVGEGGALPLFVPPSRTASVPLSHAFPTPASARGSVASQLQKPAERLLNDSIRLDWPVRAFRRSSRAHLEVSLAA